MPQTRDLRLDLFRGLALVFIFVNHIPHNAASWLTNRSWGFSDATEIFVFVSGYAAALAYGGVARRAGYAQAVLRVLRRVWTLYAAHILLFVVFIAQISYLSLRAGNPMLAEEMAVMDFLRDPGLVLLEALQLKFRPVNMDVLPLYIALLLALPPILYLAPRRPLLLLAGSAGLYAAVQFTGFNLAAYPEGSTWFFNPFAWQFLFVLGVLAASWPGAVRALRQPTRLLDWTAGLYLAAAMLIVLSWSAPVLASLLPGWFERLIYPIKKTDLDILRLVHFLALAHVALRLLPAQSPALAHWSTALFRACGRHSLPVFCCGIFLSFTGHFVVVQTGGGVIVQFAVSAAGIAAMAGLACFLDWIRRTERAAASAQAHAPVPAPASAERRGGLRGRIA